jgi:arylsulfatase A-like enzyme
VLAASTLVACAGEPPPSILLVTLDTLRRDHVGAYGSTMGLTRELDAFAANALVHDAAYTTMPTTGPAHASLFTGLLPSEHGSLQNGRHLSREHAKREAPRGPLARATSACRSEIPGEVRREGREARHPRSLLDLRRAA